MADLRELLQHSASMSEIAREGFDEDAVKQEIDEMLFHHLTVVGAFDAACRLEYHDLAERAAQVVVIVGYDEVVDTRARAYLGERGIRPARE